MRLLLSFFLFVPDDVKFCVLSPIFVYSMAVSVTLMVLAGTIQLECIANMAKSDNFRESVSNLRVMTYYIPVQIIPFTFWTELGKQERFLNSWIQLQVLYYITLNYNEKIN